MGANKVPSHELVELLEAVGLVHGELESEHGAGEPVLRRPHLVVAGDDIEEQARGQPARLRHVVHLRQLQHPPHGLSEDWIDSDTILLLSAFSAILTM